MIQFSQLRQIHLEITNNCQASCPMCTRNIHGGLPNPNIVLQSWSLDKYKNIISSEVIQQIESIYFCGNFGDPLVNNDLLDMVRYTVSTKENKDVLEMRIHTNGSMRNQQWWHDLADALPEKHQVIFAIDGLEDTHSIYRIGTNFNKIIENAKAFISNGGKAEWAFIRFKHNQHQVEQAESMARELGFEKFTMKDSSRWLLEPKWAVLDKEGNVDYYLEKSDYSEIKILDNNIISNYKQILEQTEIKCYAKHLQEVYIDAHGNLMPCCWLGTIPYQPKDIENELSNVRVDINKEYYELVESLGGKEFLNAENNSIKDIINSEAYQTVWDYYWNDKKLITCGRACGVRPDLFSTPNDQFTKRENL